MRETTRGKGQHTHQRGDQEAQIPLAVMVEAEIKRLSNHLQTGQEHWWHQEEGPVKNSDPLPSRCCRVSIIHVQSVANTGGMAVGIEWVPCFAGLDGRFETLNLTFAGEK